MPEGRGEAARPARGAGARGAAAGREAQGGCGAAGAGAPRPSASAAGGSPPSAPALPSPPLRPALQTAGAAPRRSGRSRAPGGGRPAGPRRDVAPARHPPGTGVGSDGPAELISSWLGGGGGGWGSPTVCGGGRGGERGAKAGCGVSPPGVVTPGVLLERRMGTALGRAPGAEERSRRREIR